MRYDHGHTETGEAVVSELSELADELVPKGRRTGVALAWVDPDGTVEVVVRPGKLPFTDASLFEIGSITKTMTATLLALFVSDGVVGLEATVGEILGTDKAGNVVDVTLEELATHRSGVPRVGAPNRVFRHPRDPYKGYDADRLIADLAAADLTTRGTVAYSNAGFDLLGHCLAIAAAQPFNQLLEQRVLRPAGMATARCQPCADGGMPRGHGSRIIGGRRWHAELGGCGGVDTTIHDAAAWAKANLLPDTVPSLQAAITLAQEMRYPRSNTEDETQHIGLSWIGQEDARFHNGGSGRFSSLLLFAPPVGAVVLLENQGPLLKRPDRTSAKHVNDWFKAQWRAEAV